MKLIKSKWNRLFLNPETAPGGAYVCITWKREVREWQVWPSWANWADYYTNDADDALGTAHLMLDQKRDSDHRATAPADCVCNACVGHIGGSN